MAFVGCNLVLFLLGATTAGSLFYFRIMPNPGVLSNKILFAIMAGAAECAGSGVPLLPAPSYCTSTSGAYGDWRLPMEDPCRESLQEGRRTAARHDGSALPRPGMAAITLVGVWTSLARRSLHRAALVPS